MALCCTDFFHGLARNGARLAGRPDLELVVLPPPVADLSVGAVEALAEQMADEVVGILTGQPSQGPKRRGVRARCGAEPSGRAACPETSYP